jgi:methionyl-tRNA formyltransferase
LLSPDDQAGQMSGRRPTIYLCGSRSFGAATLDLVCQRGNPVVGVAGPTTDEKGRSDRLYQRVQERYPEIPYTSSEEFRATSIPEGTDLVVAAHSHVFIGARARERTRLGCIGYHPSLLPLHRGRDAIRWTVHMREQITGGTVYWFTDKVDGGPIAAQDWCFVRPEWTAGDLWSNELFPLGLRLFGRVLDDIEAGRIIRQDQDESLASWEPSWDRPPMERQPEA